MTWTIFWAVCWIATDGVLLVDIANVLDVGLLALVPAVSVPPLAMPSFRVDAPEPVMTTVLGSPVAAIVPLVIV